MSKLRVCGFKDKLPDGAVVINTTSRSTDFGKAFSPFMNQGPIELYGLAAHNGENFFQFSKTYQEHLENTQAGLRWRAAGFANRTPHRYPMGKGVRPLFGYVNKELGRLDYIAGRKLVYIPAYLQKLQRYCETAVARLLKMLEDTDVWLWDFDGYDNDDSFDTILHNEKRNMGHAFIVRQYCLDRLNDTNEVMRYAK